MSFISSSKPRIQPPTTDKPYQPFIQIGLPPQSHYLNQSYMRNNRQKSVQFSQDVYHQGNNSFSYVAQQNANNNSAINAQRTSSFTRNRVTSTSSSNDISISQLVAHSDQTMRKVQTQFNKTNLLGYAERDRRTNSRENNKQQQQPQQSHLQFLKFEVDQVIQRAYEQQKNISAQNNNQLRYNQQQDLHKRGESKESRRKKKRKRSGSSSSRRNKRDRDRLSSSEESLSPSDGQIKNERIINKNRQQEQKREQQMQIPNERSNNEQNWNEIDAFEEQMQEHIHIEPKLILQGSASKGLKISLSSSKQSHQNNPKNLTTNPIINSFYIKENETTPKQNDKEFNPKTTSLNNRLKNDSIIITPIKLSQKSDSLIRTPNILQNSIGNGFSPVKSVHQSDKFIHRRIMKDESSFDINRDFEIMIKEDDVSILNDQSSGLAEQISSDVIYCINCEEYIKSVKVDYHSQVCPGMPKSQEILNINLMKEKIMKVLFHLNTRSLHIGSSNSEEEIKYADKLKEFIRFGTECVHLNVQSDNGLISTYLKKMSEVNGAIKGKRTDVDDLILKLFLLFEKYKNYQSVSFDEAHKNNRVSVNEKKNIEERKQFRIFPSENALINPESRMNWSQARNPIPFNQISFEEEYLEEVKLRANQLNKESQHEQQIKEINNDINNRFKSPGQKREINRVQESILSDLTEQEFEYSNRYLEEQREHKREKRKLQPFSQKKPILIPVSEVEVSESLFEKQSQSPLRQQMIEQKNIPPNVLIINHPNILEDQVKKQRFFILASAMKRQLNKKSEYLISDIWYEVYQMGIPEKDWSEYISEKFEI